jgi:N,N'-diacetyllegionaminate synthase
MIMLPDRVFIVAEIGVNHNGSVALAEKMVVSAARAGADAVKFQTFSAHRGISAAARKADYQIANTGHAGESQRDMVARYELSFKDHVALKKVAEQHGLVFFSKPADPESADLLESTGVELYKIGSGDINNLPLIRHVARKNKPIILSTGTADIAEVCVAIQAIESVSSRDVYLLHCSTEYPCPYADVNLRAMLTLRRTFGKSVGYSDHTLGIEIPVAAVAMGARIIEKHFTLDRGQPGPDHKASLEPQEFRAMVQAIRNVEAALGDGIKRAAPGERHNIDFVRRSVVAVRDLQPGVVVTRENVTVKRPGTGISPVDLEKIIGLRLAHPVKADEVLTWDHFRVDDSGSAYDAGRRVGGQDQAVSH